MSFRNIVISLALSLIFYSSLGRAIPLDLSELLFGIEYTFQDEKIIAEKGRNNIRDNPYKVRKETEMAEAYATALDLDPKKSIEVKSSWKKGLYVIVPEDGKHIINAEPVTIEVNTTPRRYDQIVEAAEPIFKAATQVGLKPYVQPAAERSGMGHIHIGGTSLGNNPFFQYPHLLRNFMVLYHKHPSLLWAHAEIFDIGSDSNIETFHSESRQEAFKKAVSIFDRALVENNKTFALQAFLKSLDSSADLLHHYRFINLEHFKKYANTEMNPDEKGKITVEFRTFRPPSSPKMAKAYSKMLIQIAESLNEMDYLEDFQWIDESQYQLFYTADYIRSDWETVKEKFHLEDPLLDESAEEFLEVFEKTEVRHQTLKDVSIMMAASPKELKGKYLQISIDSGKSEKPVVKLGGKKIKMFWLSNNKNSRWVGFIDSIQMGVDPTKALKGDLDVTLSFESKMELKYTCEALF